MGDALTAELERLAALRAFGDLDGCWAFEGLYFELCAERGLREGDGHHAVQIVAVALKEFVGLHVEDDV